MYAGSGQTRPRTEASGLGARGEANRSRGASQLRGHGPAATAPLRTSIVFRKRVVVRFSRFTRARGIAPGPDRDQRGRGPHPGRGPPLRSVFWPSSPQDEQHPTRSEGPSRWRGTSRESEAVGGRELGGMAVVPDVRRDPRELVQRVGRQVGATAFAKLRVFRRQGRCWRATLCRRTGL